ncbi:MAG TPA: GNAT family N-acetyltransferase [Pirellulaceae bacterium]|jgi:putative acetyltransferase|nr:GNAT family N-acetyltransferase [Pirellulaceae bacterium]
MPDAILLRRFRQDDLPALIDLFRDTVRRVNVRDYTPEQVRAWAPDEIDPAKWRSFEGRFAIVAEAEGRIVGFADLEADGHLDRFFVHAEMQGRGVGRALLQELLREAERLSLPRIFADVSITARPFFERHGFVVLAEQSVEVRGERLTNYRMELALSGRS